MRFRLPDFVALRRTGTNSACCSLAERMFLSRCVARRPLSRCAFLLFCLLPVCSNARAASELVSLNYQVCAPQELSLPSQSPSGDAVDDRIWITWYEPQNVQSSTQLSARGQIPAVVLLHYLGTTNNREMERFGRYLARRGIAAAVMTLPFHMKRLPSGDKPARHYFASNPDVGVQAFRQASSDVSTVVTWILTHPEIDAKRIGIAGISLGAIVTHLAMGEDERLSAGVAMLGAGDLPEIYRHSIVGRLLFHTDPELLDAAAIAKVREIDPLTYANRNRPRHVLMIQAARDSFIPRLAAENTWEALGRPPIQWIDTNHPALSLVPGQAMRTATAYLESVWNGSANDPAGESSTGNDLRNVPQLRVPTITTGVIFGLDSVATPAVQLQVFSLGTRNHMALLHADLGWSGRGAFVGLAATVNEYADVGIGRRFAGHDIKPYVSLHIAF